MKINRIALQGFRSFRAQQSLDTTGMPPGLYHVAGENLLEPTLEANGVGKSSLFEAPGWALYGRTSRGIRAGAVKSWSGKAQCAVLLSGESEAGPLSIYRTWSPNALTITVADASARPVDQQELEQLVGIPPAAFHAAVHFAQFAPAFVDLPPAEQTALFVSVLNLQLWDQASVLAGERAAAQAQEAQQLREHLARLQGQAEELLTHDYAADEQAWQVQQDAAVKHLSDSLASAKLKHTNAQQQVKGAAKTEAVATAATTTLHEAGAAAAVARDTVRRLFDALSALNRKNITKCPTCGGPISNAHIKAEIARTEKELAAATTTHKATQAGIDAAQTDAARFAADLERVREAKATLITIEREVNTLYQQLTAEQRKANLFTALRTETDRRGAELADAIQSTQDTLDTATTKTAHFQFWQKGFKEVRLAQIKHSLDQLTVEVNEVLFQLGLHDWSFEFDIERETKAGTINKSFTTLVHSPYTEDAVPWEVWSGGESQRLRLACAMGFANLICARSGIQPNIEMWDEPSSWLSGAGIDDLLSVLAARAQRTAKVILLADHRALAFGGFAGRILIRKDAGGSCIVTEGG